MPASGIYHIEGLLWAGPWPLIEQVYSKRSKTWQQMRLILNIVKVRSWKIINVRYHNSYFTVHLFISILYKTGSTLCQYRWIIRHSNWYWSFHNFVFIIWWNWIAYHIELRNDACKRYCSNDFQNAFVTDKEQFSQFE